MLAPPPAPIPTAGMVIRSSVTFRPGVYALAGKEGSPRKAGGEMVPTFTQPVLDVVGDGITVDLTGVELRGTPLATDPDRRRGLALRVRGRGVTIKGLRARGYRTAVLAEDCAGLRLVDLDLSDNFKPRLYSTAEKEDLRDWMSFHHNENGEWMRHAPAVYLDRCGGAEVRGVTIRRGANGLLMNRTTGTTVTASDISYNSGVGIGLYRSSQNRIVANRLDYNVRGFSYGKYNRGQDSAAILVFEDCDRNTFAYNSATHSGDGFFLWAGQSTMDTGRGGCDDNLVFANDFSHAPTNGIEATFSRNRFIANRVSGCAHGVWGGYSYDSVFEQNWISENRTGIAIEHGRRNIFRDNRLIRNDVAISLWANERQDPAWAYPRKHETTSADNLLAGGLFFENGLSLDLKRTVRTKIVREPIVTAVSVRRDKESDVTGEWTLIKDPMTEDSLEASQSRSLLVRNLMTLQASVSVKRPEILDRVFAPFPKGEGWRSIYVGEWGPWDGERPLLAPERLAGAPVPLPGANSAAGSGRPVPQAPKASGWYDVLGPDGRWRINGLTGYAVTPSFGKVPGRIHIVPLKGFVGDARLELEYKGGRTIDERGRPTPAGRKVPFGLPARFAAPLAWTVTSYPWTLSTDAADPNAPPEPNLLAAALAKPPIAKLETDALDLSGYGKFFPGVPATNFATVAETALPLSPGRYELDLLTDDGARVLLDGQVIWESWKYQGPTAYQVPLTLTGKTHRLRIEHFQITGYAALKAALRRKP